MCVCVCVCVCVCAGRTRGAGLPRNETTFAEVLGAHGYDTAMLGKWHLGQRAEFMPNARGFDYYLGVPFSVDMGYSVWHPPIQPNPPFQPTPLPLVEGTAQGGWAIIEQPCALNNLTARYTAKATEFITNHSTSVSFSSAASAAGGGRAGEPRPFVLYMSFSHVHNPQFCSSEFCGTSSVVGTGPAVPSAHGGTGAALQEMDDAVGVIMRALKDSALDEDTLVFFTSDNGAPDNHANSVKQGTAAGSNWPLSGFKGSISEGGIRMPAMVRWPGRVPARSTSAELAATYDIFATMLALAGAPLPAGRVGSL